MIETSTSLSSNGLKEWLLQRVTAVFIGIYTLFLAVYFLSHPGLAYDQWHALFANDWMRTATLVVVLSVSVHAWLGLWIVITDYVKPWCVRLLVEVLVALALLSFLLWGFEILWR
ncbi:MAG TPA: succinate dehydrogenase, hydrophobic membrane anchor protein [Gammaproteobacteria bacterium]|nr:succinate dehydrogenase, hydrophobic membrane anchor protein [Gammaproteobacteria bacterium]